MQSAVDLSGALDNRRAGWWVWLAVMALAVLLAACGPRQPVHGGKRLSQWFAEAVEGTANPQDVREAFEAIEGDAVPFLIREIRQGRRAMTAALTNAPNPWLLNPAGKTLQTLGLQTETPGPEARHRKAYKLLEVVASKQRELAEMGTPSQKPSITNTFPLLRETFDNPRLQEPNDAVSVILAAGPLAAVFLPDLLTILTNSMPDDPRTPLIMLALGRLGDAAIPSIPYLIRVASDARRPAHQRYWAAEALGQFGPASQSAAPLIATLLREASAKATQSPHQAHIRTVTCALASVGRTPEEAVAILEQVAACTNDWERVPALIALWNRQPENAALRSEIVAALTSSNPGPAVVILARLGTNAAVFAPQMRGLTNHPLRHVRVGAARFFRAVERAGQ